MLLRLTERLWEPLPISRVYIVFAICLVVVSILSWVISLSLFSLVVLLRKQMA